LGTGGGEDTSENAGKRMSEDDIPDDVKLRRVMRATSGIIRKKIGREDVVDDM
jgi:hypothetical protein